MNKSVKSKWLLKIEMQPCSDQLSRLIDAIMDSPEAAGPTSSNQTANNTESTSSSCTSVTSSFRPSRLLTPSKKGYADVRTWENEQPLPPSVLDGILDEYSSSEEEEQKSSRLISKGNPSFATSDNNMVHTCFGGLGGAYDYYSAGSIWSSRNFVDDSTVTTSTPPQRVSVTGDLMNLLNLNLPIHCSGSSSTFCGASTVTSSSGSIFGRFDIRSPTRS